MTESFLARQPIVDDQDRLVGFELLFRSGRSGGANVADNSAATASVVVNAFSELGIARVLGTHKGFINVNAELLHSDLIELLPREQVVLEILESETIDAPLLRRCRELRQKGYSLALDDVAAITPERELLLPVLDVIKLDLKQIAPSQLPGLARRLQPFSASLLAEKVENRDQARQCAEIGFGLFQGYYFARPETLSAKRIDPSKLALLRVLRLTLTDAATEEIEKIFKESPELTYKLLRIVNSAAAGLTRGISSLQEAIMLLGRKALQHWVQLLLYATGRAGDHGVSPLMQLAATRGRLMETAAAGLRPNDREYAARAFMVGMLSLLDTLLGAPLNEILKQLGLSEDVCAALLEHRGELGTMLSLCETLEANDEAAAQRLLKDLPGLDWSRTKTAELEAVGWANSIAT